MERCALRQSPFKFAVGLCEGEFDVFRRHLAVLRHVQAAGIACSEFGDESVLHGTCDGVIVISPVGDGDCDGYAGLCLAGQHWLVLAA